MKTKQENHHPNTPSFITLFLLSLTILSNLHPNIPTATPAIYSYKDRSHPIIGQTGMVASQEAIASNIGLKILKEGGNAVDAAVAIGYALAVTLPRAGNIGGGGFMMIYTAKDQKIHALDFREKAPMAATETLFLKEDGTVDTEKSRFSIHSVGVPGTVAGLSEALKKHGSFPLRVVMAPAIDVAEGGIKVSPDLADSLKRAYPKMKNHPASLEAFYKGEDNFYEVGDTLIQPFLTKTLRRIAKYGPKDFYEGKIADKIIDYMKEKDGLITYEDLKNYKPVWRDPIKATYKDYEIATMPPPSSGGIHLVQLLNLVEPYPLKKMGHNSAQSIHLLSEAMKLAYADRARYLGDPDFTEIPQNGLISKDYATLQRSKINLINSTPAQDISHGSPFPYESNETTHFSVVDRWGNMVAVTYTLNFSYGNQQVVPDTGILLNNQMDDFSAKPGEANAYGLIGGKANAIAPEKRMLSSMTPTIVLNDNEAILALGSPGGSRIITTVFQVLLNLFEHDMSLQDAINAPRVHHQWLPDETRIETGLSQDTLKVLKEKGHKIRLKHNMGSVQAVGKENGYLIGGSDPRKPGSLAIGY